MPLRSVLLTASLAVTLSLPVAGPAIGQAKDNPRGVTRTAQPEPSGPIDPSDAPKLPADILPFDEVRAGMTGTGRTVLTGGEVAEFRVEILGRLFNFGPGRNLILARLSGAGLETTGVMQGMSGSPVYIEGRMIGAVAYSWAFATEPVAGITPIGEMIRDAGGGTAGAASPAATSQTGGIAAGAGAARPSVLLPERLRRPAAALDGPPLVAFYRDRLVGLLGPAPAGAGPRPAGLAYSLGGLGQDAIRRLTGLAGTRVQFLAGGSSDEEAPPLVPGAAVGVSLVRGDVDMTAFGTVTRIDGDRLFAFGHPLFGLGQVDLPLVRGRIEGLMPNLRQSFKFAAAAGEAGAVTADRPTGITGRLGPVPRTIPVRLEIAADGDAARAWRFEIADDPLLSPVLVFLTLGGLFDSVRERAGAETLEMMDGSVIRLDGGRTVSLANLYSGSDAVLIASATVAFLSQVLLENEFEPSRIEGINLVVRARAERRVARIRGAWADRSQVRPGDTLAVSVALKPFRRAEESLTIRIEIPPETPPGPLTVHVGDALSLHRAGEETPPRDWYPRDLDHLVGLINRLRRSERIYVLATRDEPTLHAGDYALPNLPPSRAAVFMTSDPSGDSRILRVRPVTEAETPTGYAVLGYRRLTVEIAP